MTEPVQTIHCAETTLVHGDSKFNTKIRGRITNVVQLGPPQYSTRDWNSPKGGTSCVL